MTRRHAPAKARSPNSVLVFTSHPRALGLAPAVRRLANRSLSALRLSGVELSIALVGDRAIRRLNRVWRKKDRVTDVLSFPAGPQPPGARDLRPLGDVIISLDTVSRDAREAGESVPAQVARCLAHGLLHLLGYDHQRPADARRMARRERTLLGSQGLIK